MPAGEKTLTWADCPGVQRHPGRLSGAWTIEDTRMPIYLIFGNLATGATITEVTEWYEGVTEDQVKTLLDHAAKNAGAGPAHHSGATMRYFLTTALPRQLRSLLPEHEVHSAAFRGWERLENGNLLQAAHDEGYEMVITCDQGITYQRNLERYRPHGPSGR